VTQVSTDQFDHHSEHFAEHWRETYAELRGSCPVAHSERHGGFYVVTRYADVKKVMGDPATFACGRELPYEGEGSGGVTVPVNPVRMGFMEMDPPDQPAHRRVLAARFTAKAIKAYEPRMAEIVAWTVDRVIESGRIDFVDDLANPLPALVSLDYFGLPLERWEDWAVALHQAAYREKGSMRKVAGLVTELNEIVAERRRTLDPGKPADEQDIVERLLTAEVSVEGGGGPMDDETVVNLIFMLLNGGIDTSTALIANMFGWLGRNPDRRAELAADPALIPAAVDEMLRYFTPGTGVARTVTRAVELGGRELRPGDRVLLALGAANLDDEMFPGADQVRLDRDNNNRHLAFGAGIHRCLGAFLAPAEMRLLLEEVLRRMPDYEIDYDAVRPYPTIPLVNGYIAMPATFPPGPTVLSGFDPALPIRRESAPV
jgi:cytochrome P450